MNKEEFDDWWFYKGGDDICIGKFDSKVTDEDIERQPSYKKWKDKDNAYIEAIYEKGVKWKKVCDKKGQDDL